MNRPQFFNQVAVDPNHLLDALQKKLNLKNDAALSRMLGVGPPMISKIRHRKLPVGASLLIRMHEVSDLNIKELRDLMGDHHINFCTSNQKIQGKESARSVPSQAPHPNLCRL